MGRYGGGRRHEYRDNAEDDQYRQGRGGSEGHGAHVVDRQVNALPLRAFCDGDVSHFVCSFVAGPSIRGPLDANHRDRR